MQASPPELWGAIASEAAAESPLWGDALRPEGERDEEPVFSPLADARYALGIETIYEGYLVHYGRSRLFSPGDGDTALLLGDYLYAHGLVRIAEVGDVEVIRDLAELVALCAQLRADVSAGDGDAWAATAALLGRQVLDEPRAALRDRGDAEPLASLARVAADPAELARALAAHARLLR